MTAHEPTAIEPKPRRRRWWPLALLVLLAAVALVPVQRIRGDGGFDSIEYRLRFTDETGRPVPGVTVRVLTPGGTVSHLYPINEFLPNSSPASAQDGGMVFHHASHGLEFGGSESMNLVGMRFGDTAAPQYLCVFYLGSREVHRVSYQDLRRWSFEEALPTVTRTWLTPEWPTKEWEAHPDDWDTHRKRLFDGNGDGELDREERVASYYFHHAAMSRVELKREKREVTFTVVERAVTIQAP